MVLSQLLTATHLSDLLQFRLFCLLSSFSMLLICSFVSFFLFFVGLLCLFAFRFRKRRGGGGGGGGGAVFVFLFRGRLEGRGWQESCTQQFLASHYVHSWCFCKTI